MYKHEKFCLKYQTYFDRNFLYIHQNKVFIVFYTATSFLDVQLNLSNARKLKTKLYKKPTDCMTLLHFHYHHPLSCKEGVIYSQALRYSMIISEYHILQEELNSITHILLAPTYPLNLIIKNIKKPSSTPAITCYPKRTPHTETNILPIITPFSDIRKSFKATIHINWHTIADDATLPAIFLFFFYSLFNVD